MKNTLFITCATVLLILSQCTSKKATTFDLEKEKALIMGLIEKNKNFIISGSKDELVLFVRKYSLDQSYTMSNDSLMFINIADSSDQAIYNGYASGAVRIVSMDEYYPPMIKVFSDGRSGYCIGKYLMTIKRDSSGVKISRKSTISFIQVFEKPDSIWKMGDCVQNIKPIR